MPFAAASRPVQPCRCRQGHPFGVQEARLRSKQVDRWIDVFQRLVAAFGSGCSASSVARLLSTTKLFGRSPDAVTR